jgi:chorismate mutase
MNMNDYSRVSIVEDGRLCFMG